MPDFWPFLCVCSPSGSLYILLRHIGASIDWHMNLQCSTDTVVTEAKGKPIFESVCCIYTFIPVTSWLDCLYI